VRFVSCVQSSQIIAALSMANEYESHLKEGETGESVDYKVNRESDPNLTPNGENQAALLGSFLVKERVKIDRIYTSPHLRSLKTTQHLTSKMDNPPDIHVHAIIHECGGCHKDGVGFPGKSSTYIRQNHPSYTISEEIDENGWWKQDLRETDEETLTRARNFLRELCSTAMENEGKDDSYCHAYVSHGAFLNLVISLIFNAEINFVSKYYLFTLVNTGVCYLECKKEDNYQLRVLGVNLSEHILEEVTY